MDIKSFVSKSFFFIWLHHMACGILVPWSGTEPGPSAIRAWSSNPWTARKFFLIFSLFKFLLFFFKPLCHGLTFNRSQLESYSDTHKIPTQKQIVYKWFSTRFPINMQCMTGKRLIFQVHQMYLKFCMLEHEVWHRINSYWILFK